MTTKEEVFKQWRKHQEALKLLQEFLNETPKGEVRLLVKKYKNLDIVGPTYSQYLKGLSKL